MDDQYVGKHSKRFQRQRRSAEPNSQPPPAGTGLIGASGDFVPGPTSGQGVWDARVDTPHTSIAANMGPDARATSPIRAQRYKARRWIRLATVAGVVVAILSAGAMGGLYVYAQQAWEAIPRISSEEIDLTEVEPGKPTTFMVVGSDTREGLSPDIAAMVGDTSDVGGQRGDTIMVIHVDPEQRKSFVISLPRDLRVDLGGGRFAKINEAYADGPQGLVDAVEDLTGLEINHYAEFDFESFSNIVDAFGGIEYCFPNDVRDTELRFRFEEGCDVLEGQRALSLVRSRNWQDLIDGRWVGDGKGDFGRIERQQEFIQKMMAKISGPGAIANINEYASIAKDYVKLDEGFDLNTAINLYRDMTPLTPDRVEFVALPVVNTNRDGVAFVELAPEAREVLARLRGQAAGQVPEDLLVEGVNPAEVTVTILNGSGKAGLAASTRARFEAAGYRVSEIGDTDRADVTTIAYGTGLSEKAESVALALGLGILEVGDTGLVDVIVTLGADAPVT